MASISTEQMRFLEKHSIPLSRVFDATGMSKAERERVMHELGMLVAIGVSPCSKGEHTMKTRSGHCPQCGTQKLAFLRRHEDSGIVYVALSKASGLIKIGTAANVTARVNSLNYYAYGGIRDWCVRFSFPCDKAGKVEFEAHKILQAYRVSKSYVKQGSAVNCQELFECELTFAHEAVITALNKLNLGKKDKIKNKIPGMSSLGIYGIKPLPLSRASRSYDPRPSRQYNELNRVIIIKGHVYLKDLAELMRLEAPHLLEDLIAMNLECPSQNGEINRGDAVILCEKRGYSLQE